MGCELLDARPGRCGWCGKKLRGRQKKWCSRTCDRAYVANHRWTQAKAAVKKDAAYYFCANANPFGMLFKSGDRVRGEWHGPEGCLVFTQAPEVNHKSPIKGKHGTFGCHHHQDGLEVLCRPCHLAETARQREEGLL